MTTLDLIRYYGSLLIYQYLGKAKAYATIQAVVNPVVMPQISTQEIDFSMAPSTGTFVLSYDSNVTASINWNDSVSTIQSKLQAVSGLNAVTVSGSIASQALIVTFIGVTPPALLLVLVSSSLDSSIEISETDLILPLAVQNSFNLLGSLPALGVQLDVIGKYAGVIRTGSGFSGQIITLDDSDFLTFIKMAIITNSAGSSLYDIDNLLFGFFTGSVLVFDYKTMRMNYLISSSIGSQNLLELFVTENLLPRPMAVEVSIIVAPVIDAFFGFILYAIPTQPPITRPFNDYSDYQTDWPWISYQDAFA